MEKQKNPLTYKYLYYIVFLQKTTGELMKSVIIPKNYLAEIYYARQRVKLPKTSNYGKYSFFVSLENIKELSPEQVELTFEKDFVNTKSQNKRAEFSIENLQAIYNGADIKANKEYVVKTDKVLEKRLNYLLETLPKEMQALPNWLVYRAKWNDEKGKKDKTLINPLTSRWAKANDSTTWTDLETAKNFAVENNFEGVAFALNGNGITCIDLDHSINPDGTMSELATDFLKRFAGTYIETSVSGNGLHIFLKGDVLEKDKFKNRALTKDGEVEVYDVGRIISLTGNVRTTVNTLAEITQENKKYLQQLLGLKAKTVSVSAPSRISLNDRDIIEQIRSSKKGKDFDVLFSGGTLTGDKSRDDMIMLNILAFFTDRNAFQMESIFKSSGLYRPEKGANYLKISIDKAIQTLQIQKSYFEKTQKKKR